MSSPSGSHCVHHRIWSQAEARTTSTKDALTAFLTRSWQNQTQNPQLSSEGDSSATPLVIASALVNMQQLVEFTTSKQLLPKVVAEFPDITVGGAIAGGGVESSSFKYGLFADAVQWMKVLMLSDGKNEDFDDDNVQVVTARRGDDLWRCMSGTFGAAEHGGNRMVILEAAIECIELESRWVCVSYYKFATMQQLCDALVKVTLTKPEAAIEESVDFVDALQFPSEYRLNDCSVVMMVGRILSRKNALNDDDRKSHSRSACVGWTRPKFGGLFFFEHVVHLVNERCRRSTSTTSSHDEYDGAPFAEEVLEIADYLFRYDPGAFWMARPMTFQWSQIVSYLPFTLAMFVVSHPLVRSLTGWFFSSSRRLYRMLHLAPQNVIASKFVLQDLYVPIARAPKLVDFIRNNVKLSVPLWLCPVRTNRNQPFTPSYDCSPRKDAGDDGSQPRTIVLNCGVYGRVPDSRARFSTLRLEEICARLGGRKMLYGQSHYSQSQFCVIYGHSSLADAVYHKTCRLASGTGGCANKPSWQEWFASWLL